MEEEFERGRGRENSGGLLVALLQRVEEAREEGGVAAAAVLELLRGDVDAHVVSGVAMSARKAACARVKASLGRRLTVRRLLKTAWTPTAVARSSRRSSFSSRRVSPSFARSDCAAGEPFSACLRSASRSVPDPASSGVDAVIEKTQLWGVLKLGGLPSGVSARGRAPGMVEPSGWIYRGPSPLPRRKSPRLPSRARGRGLAWRPPSPKKPRLPQKKRVQKRQPLAMLAKTKFMRVRHPSFPAGRPGFPEIFSLFRTDSVTASHMESREDDVDEIEEISGALSATRGQLDK